MNRTTHTNVILPTSSPSSRMQAMYTSSRDSLPRSTRCETWQNPSTRLSELPTSSRPTSVARPFQSGKKAIQPRQQTRLSAKEEANNNSPLRSIFLPDTYDQTSPNTLPTLFTIHGGGFCIGDIRGDDEWNRTFANGQNILVVALNYSNAPENPFPTAVHDVAALLHAVLADESLPIDRTPRAEQHNNNRSRTAILGFSAGGNLALSVSQLPSVRGHPYGPEGAISCYGYLDMSIRPQDKLPNRPWKPSLSPPRNATTQPLTSLAPAFDWSYIPYGQNLRDPLLSPYYAPRETLPPFVGVVAAELDTMAHESWRFACRLAQEGVAASFGTGNNATAAVNLRQVPDRMSEDPQWRVCGRETVGRVGELTGVGPEDRDERFAFEENWDTGGVKWLLVPDVMHGFDNPTYRWAIGGGKETIEDAEMKAEACRVELGRWLRETVWCL